MLLCSNLNGESNWALSCEVVVISYLIIDFMITNSNYVAVVKLCAMLKYVLHRAENHNHCHTSRFDTIGDTLATTISTKGIGDIDNKCQMPRVPFSLIRERPLRIFIYLRIRRYLDAKRCHTIRSHDHCHIAFIYVS